MVIDSLCRVSGHFGVFISIAYALDGAVTTPDIPARPFGKQVMSIRQSTPGNNTLEGLFSVYDLVSAYQWAYYRVTAPLDPYPFDMDAYLATSIKLYPLVTSSSAVQLITSYASVSLDRPTIYDLLSAYVYAMFGIPPLLSVALNLGVDDGLELSEAALMFYYPELLPGTTGDSSSLRLSATVLHWLGVYNTGPEAVSTAWIEELDDHDQQVVPYGPEPPPDADNTHIPSRPQRQHPNGASTIALAPSQDELFLGLFSTHALRAAFAYAYHAIRTVEVRFTCSTLRVVHRTKAADFNVHVFNERTRARLLTLVEDPPAAFCMGSRPAAFARAESFASTATESSSSDGTDSDFPYTDDSEFDFGNGFNVVGCDLGLNLDLGINRDMDMDSGSDGEACDSDLDEMTWMLDELTVDDYPALYDWELEELVRALTALSVDDLLCLRASDLDDLLALLRTVLGSLDSDDSAFASASASAVLGPRDAGYLVDVERKLLAVKARLPLYDLDGELEPEGLVLSSLSLSPSPSLEGAIAQLLSDGEALEARVPPASDKYRVLQELLARLRSRRADTGDLLPAVPVSRKDKGKGKALAVDDHDDGDDALARSLDRSARRLPRTHRGREGVDASDADVDADSDDAEDAPGPAAQRRKKRHRGGKRIPMAERRRRNRRTVQVTLAPLREMEFVEGPSWCPEDEMWFEGFGMW